MIDSWRREGSEFSSSADDVEIETLQTDVMRFMAILGFILSVIFALVQSLPFLPKDKNPSTEQHDSVKVELENLKIRIQSQLIFQESVQQQIDRSLIVKAKTEQELLKMTDQRSQIAEKSQLIFDSLKESQARAATLNKEFLAKNKSLQILRQQVETEWQKLSVVQKRLVRLEKKVLESNRRVEPIRIDRIEPIAKQNPKSKSKSKSKSKQAKLQRKAKPINKPARTQISKPPPVPKRVGFSLKFKSERALDRLVGSQFIEFYVFAGDLSWRVYLVRGKPEFKVTRKPSHFHEMNRITVPGHYLTAFNTIASASGKNNEVWGVKLPIGLSRRIKTQIKDKKGGDIVIDGSGGMEIENLNL